MDFEQYRNEIDHACFQADFQQRTLQKLRAAQSEEREKVTMKKTHRSVRLALIAAVLVLAVSISAAAVAAISNAHTKTRENLGIKENSDIAEYREYDDENAPIAENENGTVKLVSTVCSGESLDAFFIVSPVEKDAGLSIQNNDALYCWDIGALDTHQKTTTMLLSQISYEETTKSSLVRVTLLSETFTELPQITIPLILRSDDEIITFAPVNVPVTSSDLLEGSADIALSCGNVTGVKIGATFVEVCFVSERIDGTVDELHYLTQEQRSAINSALEDAAIQLKDGTNIIIRDLKTPWAHTWVLIDGDLAAMEAGDFSVQHLCAEVLDTSQIESVTICGTVIPVE